MSAPQSKPLPMPGADPKPVTTKARWWDDDTCTVLLVPCQFGKDDSEVYLPAKDGSLGEWIGTVGKYEGSLDRKISGTRLISPGKRRTLWFYRGTYEGARSIFDQVSRADCIRSLVDTAERRRKGSSW